MPVKTVELTIGGRSFVCFPLAEAAFINVAAVYVIIGVNPAGGWKVLDVGETGELGERIEHHPRRECWKQSWPSGNIWVCVHAMPTKESDAKARVALEAELRDTYRPPCGQR